ncbi:MAG: zf-HC2 domain-containing protein, partial [Candidatus Zixiibacteriota bacterium]
MMEHSYFKDRLSAYFDGELAPPEKTAVREHLETCAECCRRIAELEKLQALIDKHGELAEGAYWEQNAEKIEARLGIAATSVTDIRPEKRGLSVWKWATAVASAVVLTFIGLHQSDILQDEPAIQLPTIPTEADSLVDSQGIDGEGLPELKDMPADGYQMSSPVPADTDGRAVRKAAHETAPRRDKKGEAIDADRSGEFEAAKPSPELPDLQEATQDPNYRPQR